jgi:hypothetical protein
VCGFEKKEEYVEVVERVEVERRGWKRGKGREI